MQAEIKALERISSSLQVNKCNKQDLACLGIAWVLLSLEKDLKENEAQVIIRRI